MSVSDMCTADSCAACSCGSCAQANSAASSAEIKSKFSFLSKEYGCRTDAICSVLEKVIASAPECTNVAVWRDTLLKNRETVLNDLADCGKQLEQMGTQVRLHQLSLAQEKVCSEVSLFEKNIMQKFTALQQVNSSSLKQVLVLGLTGTLKTLDAENRALLLQAIDLQTDCTQFLSNEVQSLEISLKECNKVITHPLDENHPE